MRLYLGSRDYRPEGFLTVDIDPTHGPDILADVTDLKTIANGSVDEICASHILEHIAWPNSFKALAEWTRVLRPGGLLRLAVPDLGMLASLIASGRVVWPAVGILFGLGRIHNSLEAHQYGYTRTMLTDILRTLGFGNFDWWKHDMPDASNGWIHDETGGKIAISLNIAATKVAEPVVPPSALLAALAADPMTPFGQTVAKLASERAVNEVKGETDPELTQRIHFALIEARMRIRYLEEEAARR